MTPIRVREQQFLMRFAAVDAAIDARDNVLELRQCTPKSPQQIVAGSNASALLASLAYGF
jgi:hypothetical protein